MNINFGGYNFSEPTKLTTWKPPYLAGLYAILIPDLSGDPLPLRVIYFGESGNMSERGFPSSHAKYSCWIAEASSEDYLSITIFPMPGSTEEQRRTIENQLISRYSPTCNQGMC